jgi:hypothetical protein
VIGVNSRLLKTSAIDEPFVSGLIREMQGSKQPGTKKKPVSVYFVGDYLEFYEDQDKECML